REIQAEIEADIMAAVQNQEYNVVSPIQVTIPEAIVQEDLHSTNPVLNKPETNEEEQEEPLQNPNADDGPTTNEVQVQDEATATH
ncbi:hypothetical protein, partial [Serratia marcescens]|uniref:hypothetical protein n=1 Tax=Serratia marcescens TaxID=615 RepID=UPI002812DD82